MGTVQQRTIDHRDLWIAARGDVDAVVARVDGAPFICLVTSSTEEDARSTAMSALIESLLAAGCVYFVCAGARAELLHDVIDATFVGDAATSSFARGVEIVTTWHAHESPEEVAFFLMHCAVSPSGASTMVAILQAEDEALRATLHSLADPSRSE
jgi:hypothetical protein